MGTCSAFFTRELAPMTNRDSPEPERKYIHGLPFPASVFASSLFQPRDRQHGKEHQMRPGPGNAQVFGQIGSGRMRGLGMNRHIGDGIACEWGKGFRGWRFRDIRKVVLQIAHLSPRTRIIVKEAHGSLVSVSSAILPPRPQPRAATAARGGR